MRATSLPRPLLAAAAALLAALCLLVFAPAGHAAVRPAAAAAAVGPSSDRGQNITRTEVRARALNWLQRNVVYSQGTPWASDPDNDQGWSSDTYRRDCSGFVSMAWHADQSYVTQTLDPDVKNSPTTHIAWSDLAWGDAILNPGEHVALFEAWIDKSAGTFRVVEESEPGVNMRERNTSIGYEQNGGFEPVRYKHITDADGYVANDVPGTSTAHCSQEVTYQVALPTLRDLTFDAHTCAQVTGDGHAKVWISASWRPVSGTQPVSGGTRLAEANTHIQLKESGVVTREASCYLQPLMEANSVGSTVCSIQSGRLASAGSFSGDGYLVFDAYGGSWQAPIYLRNSPAV